MRGSSSNSGPSADPDAIRRDRNGHRFLTLPVGRTGKPPAWPSYIRQQDETEAAIWADLWILPQATVWESHHMEAEVALYARTLAKAQQRGVAAAWRVLVMRQQDSLGLSLAGLRANRWQMPSLEPSPVATWRPTQADRARLRSFKTLIEDKSVSRFETVIGPEGTSA